jgi:Spy/CpxP family protein refolding chaperone
MLRKSLFCSFVCVLLAVPVALRAADDKSPDTKKSKAAPADATAKSDAGTSDDSKPKGRLPNNWGKLGLTAAQKDKVYSIESSYSSKIEEMQKAIADLQTKRDTEMRGVLTADQQKQLDALAVDSTKAKAAKKAAAADAKSGKASDAKGDSSSGAAKNASASK